MLKQLFTLLFCIHFALAAYESGNRRQIGGRIVGGYETDITDHPYQVSLEYNYAHLCGGVIISRTSILTTSSCIIATASFYRVRVGTSFLGVGGQLINVSSITTHSGYYNFDFDIALLRLEKPITLSRSAQTIRLPNNGDLDLEGLTATVTGWGHTDEEGSESTVLQAVDVQIISRSVCADLYRTLGYNVTETMLCAGFWDGGKDACQEDGGGPLVIDSVLYGLVSWGVGCARPQRPGVYTDVGAFRDWITEQTGI